MYLGNALCPTWVAAGQVPQEFDSTDDLRLS
jgi:hypothetical protein